MRQLNPLMTLCFITAFVLVAASCSKTGTAGATGPAGATGATGATGTANVIYSAWLDVTYKGNVQTSGDTLWEASITAAKLDTSMLNKGEIKVYWNSYLSGTPDVYPLPYNDGGNIILVDFTLQKIYLTSNGNWSTGIDSQTKQKYFQYRYILIPGGTSGRSAVDWNNYAEVKKYLNLKD